MEKELMTLVQSKSYNQLTAVELEQLSEWCSNEEEFEQLKYLFTELENSNAQQINQKVSGSVKESLDQIFQEQFPTKKKSEKHFYLIIKRPYIQFAAMVLLILLCYPLFYTGDKEQASSQKQVALVTNKTRKNLVNGNKHKNSAAPKHNFTLDVFPELVVESNEQEAKIARVESQFLDSSKIARLDFSNDFKVPSINEIPYSESIVSAVEIVPVEKLNSQRFQETTVSLDLLDLLTPCF